MIRPHEDARRLAGKPGATFDLRNHIMTDRPLQAYAYGAVMRWPDEAFALLRRYGLTLELAFDFVPAAMLRHVFTGDPLGLHGGDLDLAADFDRDVQAWRPADWREGREHLETLLSIRMIHWVPILLEHWAAEIRRLPPFKTARLRDRRLALLALLRVMLTISKGGDV